MNRVAMLQMKGMTFAFWMRTALLAFAWCLSPLSSLQAGQQTWEGALAAMPLPNAPAELNRTNCVSMFLEAFQSNDVVKALVFMPGATDEFYLFRRARAVLNGSQVTLLDAVCALTNQTFIQADFRNRFLLLHTTEDRLEGDNRLQDPGTAQRLKQRVRVAHLNFNDRDWDFLQPLLKRSLKISLRPWRYSTDSWHFYRHSFAAWNVDGVETLELAALAGKSKFVLNHQAARFEVDPRAGPAPRFDAHLR
jgi:hypothetical protein